MSLRALILAACGFACAIASNAAAQSLDDHFDEERYLRGLGELNLPEVLEHYIAQHPPTDDVQATAYAIVQQRMILREPGAASTDREAAVHHILAQRNELLDAHPNDPRRAQWLADQAADVYFELLTIDASGLMTHLGMPTAEQRDRAGRAARLMLDYAQRAEHAIDLALLDLEATPGFAQSIPLQLQRRRMAEEQRDRQIPFLHGIARYLHGAFNIDDTNEQRRLFEQASRMLAPLGEELHVPLNHHAKLYAAFANARLGRREAAHAAFNELMYVASGDRLLTLSAQIGAAMHASDPRSKFGRLAEQYSSADDLFFRLLVADAIFHYERERSPSRAFDAYTQLLEENLAIDTDRLREIVFARLTLAVDPSMRAGSLPHIVVIAMAGRMARDDSTRDEAIALLSRLIDDRTVHGDDRALALLSRGRAHHAAGRNVDAARDYINLARENARSPDAERAIEWGVSLAAAAREDSPDALPVLRDGLELLLRQYPNLPTVNRWRFVAGQVALGGSHYDEALAHFRSVAPRSSHAPQAAYMQARTLSMAAVAATGNERRRDLYLSTLQTAAEAQPILESAMRNDDDVDRTRQLREHLASLQVIEGHAHLALGDAEKALEAVDGLDADGDLRGGIVAESMQLRIEAYQSMNRIDDAQREIDRFIAAAPQRVGQVLLPWLRTVEHEVLNLLEQHDEQTARELAMRQLSPLAERLKRWVELSPHGEPHAEAILPRVADAYRLSHRFEDALALYDRLLAEQPSAAPLLFGRAECLFHLAEQGEAERRLGDAMLLYRRLTTAGPGVGPTLYWQSHLRSLQILDRMDRNTQQIVPQIQRLRQRDRDLGGERFRRAFDELQNKHSSLGVAD